jgi:hypothetical protein
MAVTIPATSTEYLSVSVTASPVGVSVTGTAPQWAFLPATNRGNPETWLTGEWDSSTARILIGPDGETTLTRGDWYVWVRLDPPNDELVVRRAGTLSVT